MATGVLAVLLGSATKVLPYLDDSTKEYKATAELGVVTDTLDAEGVVIEERTADVDPAGLEKALDRLGAQTQQLPPAFSALKVDGRRAYRLAREGREVRLAPRPVSVLELELLDYRAPSSDPGRPSLDLRIVCGRGTYVRALVRDLGEMLGTGATLTSLQRTRSGPYRIEDALPLAVVESDPGLSLARIIPLGRAVEHLRTFRASAQEIADLLNGRRLAVPSGLESLEAETLVAALDPEGRLVAVARVSGSGDGRLLKPDRVWKEGRT